MNSRKIITSLLAITFLATAAMAVEITPQQKLMSRRAAEADAYRKLATRIMGMRFSSGTTVRDFATESDDIAVQLNHFIKGVRIPDESVSYYDDGSCEVVAEVTLEKVISTLKKVRDSYYDGKYWKDETFDELSRDVKREVISEVGCGAASETTLMPEPANMNYVEPIVNSGGRRISLPSIYRKYGARRRLMAKRAAEMDAYRKLVERIYGLQLDSSTHVSDLMEVNDEIRLSSQAFLKGVRTGTVCYQPDGVVQVQMSVTIEQVTNMLRKVVDEKYDGKRWTTSTIDTMKRDIKRKVITVVGEGALDVGRDTTRTSGTIEVGTRVRSVTEVVETTTVIVLD